MTAPGRIDLKYRADIDGLRAIAVVPVMLFHLGIAGFGGGYVGVDVFFVVSGYLITSIIAAEVEAGTFTLVGFYERRIRRILPALTVVTAASVPVAMIVLVPAHLENFGQSVIATAAFVSNFFFYLEDGYFEGPAELHPLLHTWSLAVEEQFYLIFPLLLLGLSRFTISFRKVLLALALLSFGFSSWQVYANPTAAFYLLPSRFWELLLGGLLALYSPALKPASATASLSSILGLTMIGFSVVAFSQATVFPGPSALIPCLGAALVIYGGLSTNPINDALGTPALRWTGLLSYSLYLWHFPLIVFTRHLIVRPFSGLEAVLLLLTTAVLALVTRRFVEQPFRQRPHRIERQALYRYAGVTFAFSLGVGLFTDFSDGAAFRLPSLARTYLEADQDKDSDCMRRGQKCFIGDDGAEPRYLIWGDSHASAILPAFKLLSEQTGISGKAAIRGGCPPLVGYRLIRIVISESCAKHSRQTFEMALNSKIDTIFLITRWSMVVEESMYGYESGRPLILADDVMPDLRETNRAVLSRALDETLAALTMAGKNVVIIGPVPEIGWDVPHTLAQRVRFGPLLDQSSLNPTVQQVLERNQRSIDLLATAARKHGARLLLPHETLCAVVSGCRVLNGTRPLYHDTHHLTIVGALELTNMLRPEFNRMARPATASVLKVE